MHETEALVGALKGALKARRITYSALARAIGLSEASVKRLFSRQTLTLKRVEEILRVLDMTLLEVAKLATSRAEEGTQLTLEQEKSLVADARLFSFFHLLLFGVSVPKVMHDYEVSKADTERWLRALARLGLVERLPRDKVRLLVARSIVWRPRGPLRLAYERRIRAHFLDGDFEEAPAIRKFATRRLSRESQHLVARKIKRLFAEIGELSELDTTGSEGGDGEVSGLFVAFRPSALDEVIGLRRRA